jgi:hypothetical protein
MKSNRKNRELLIGQIIEHLESEFPGVIVAWRNTGTYGDDFKDDTEVFEAYMVGEEIYDDFTDFVWKMADLYAYPNGFSIMIHDLTPEETKEYRWEEYQSAKSGNTERQLALLFLGWQYYSAHWTPRHLDSNSLQEGQINGIPFIDVA